MKEKKFIKMRAQSYAFSVVIALLLIEIGQNLYFSFFFERLLWRNKSLYFLSSGVYRLFNYIISV